MADHDLSRDSAPKPSRRLLFLISGIGGGQGGHFHSLKDLALVLQGHAFVRILCIGPDQTRVFDDTGLDVEFVSTAGQFSAAYRRAKCIAKRVQPDVVHAFDAYAYSFAVEAARQVGAGVLLTKAGGPNPTSYFPKSPRVVCFSRENTQFFESRGQRTAFIPARVSSSRLAKQDFLPLPGSSPESLDIVRIGRIGYRYAHAIESAVATLRAVQKSGINSRLVLLGVVQSESYYREVMSGLLASDHSIVTMTDPATVRNASQYLDCSQIVVGTGRGCMEALWRGCSVLCPVREGGCAELVDDASIATLLDTNFSGRSSAVRPEPDRAMLVRSIASDARQRQDTGLRGRRLFAELFELESRVPEYLSLYDESRLTGAPTGAFATRLVNAAYSWRGLRSSSK